MGKDDKFYVFLFVTTFIFMGVCTFILGKSIDNFRTDYMCTQMPDEAFYETQMCKDYWPYRKSGLK